MGKVVNNTLQNQDANTTNVVACKNEAQQTILHDIEECHIHESIANTPKESKEDKGKRKAKGSTNRKQRKIKGKHMNIQGNVIRFLCVPLIFLYFPLNVLLGQED